MNKLFGVIVCLLISLVLVSCTDDTTGETGESGETSIFEETIIETEEKSEITVTPAEEFVTYTNINFSAVYYNPVKTVVEDENGETLEEITFEEVVLVENSTLDVDFPKNVPVTVLDAVKSILTTKEVFYVEDFSSIVCIAEQSERVEDGYFYVWEYEIDGVIPNERACNIPLKSDMTIVYILTAEPDKSPSVETETEDSYVVVPVSNL